MAKLLDELYELLARLKDQPTPYLMAPQEENDLCDLLDQCKEAVEQDGEEGRLFV